MRAIFAAAITSQLGLALTLFILAAGCSRLVGGDAGNDGGQGDAAGVGDGSAASEYLGPRPISPPSTSTVSSQMPTLRWSLPHGYDGVHVQICRDRSCTEPEVDFVSTAMSAPPNAPLLPGVHFWRVYGQMSGVDAPQSSPTWEFWVGARSAAHDSHWGSTLDLNGDGFADLAMMSTVSSEYATVDIFVGGSNGVTARTTLSVPTPVRADQWGNIVASAGDVNGDGYADLIIGASGLGTGAAYVYFGDPVQVVQRQPAVLTGDGPMSYFGWSVAGAGDVDGDGFGDVIVGSPEGNPEYANMPYTGDGAVFLFRGGLAGPETRASVVLHGDISNGEFGFGVAGAGDVNADGYDDVVIASNDTNFYNGSARVFLGDANAPLGGAAILLPPGASWVGNGWAVSTAGDVNGDGFADVVTGKWDSNSTQGVAFVYLGSSTGPVTDAPIVITDLPTTSAAGAFGGTAGLAGDVNGDGYSDLAFGAFGELEYGAAYVWFGRSETSTPPATVRLAGADMEGQFGFKVGAAGDLNGDGIGDLLVSAPGADMDSGRVYLYLGDNAGAFTTAPIPLVGSAGFFGCALAVAPPEPHRIHRRTRS